VAKHGNVCIWFLLTLASRRINNPFPHHEGGADLNTYILKHIGAIEMIGVLMRIFSFSLVSWFGPASPFLFVWILNTLDAAILSWCAVLKKDHAYTVLNLFWIMVGVTGILRAGQVIH
jgi:hypothetical protein